MAFECSSGFEQAREGLGEGICHAESLAAKAVGVEGGQQLATILKGVGHGGVLGGVEGLEGEVFEFGFEAPDTELAGEGDVDVLFLFVWCVWWWDAEVSDLYLYRI